MQVSFETPLVLERVERSWRLHAPFLVRVDSELFAVPAGFETDLASVPRLPIAFYLAGGRGVKAAVLHDFFYETGAVSRDRADSIFYHTLLAEGEPELIAKAMHDAVRLAGGALYLDGAQALDVQAVEYMP